ncbi:S-DNA-T family DNA segregation ATPase FtsK/SpoIIIE [Azospirillum fermentarium]|uniref:DNA translocase FtsK n=1 Tax=Azospirillum fermentarium TaxID=1233114 RepID=UPI0022280AC7|nr:DNA translocase FtsK [Azospirillum fermentarium]MCW2244731.1 S-DNA-T family DNA segregation ATPase FtsK/SpoIIIE [Azospirillum fermentarium]
MTPRMPHVIAPVTQSGIVTADEFNLWCALNGRPFNLTAMAAGDGRLSWAVEVLPGTPRAGTVYSTGMSDEALAVVAGFAFLAGVEWADEVRVEEEPDAVPAPVPAALPLAEEAPAVDAPPVTAAAADAPDADFPGADAPAEADAVTEEAPVPEDVAPENPVDDAAMDEDAGAAHAEDGAGPDDADGFDAAAADEEDGDGDEEEEEDVDGETAEEEPFDDSYHLPPVHLLQSPPPAPPQQHDETVLAHNARMLETVLKNFRVRGEIMEVRPGPVVTLYEFEPAPGTKSATVINLTDDIARSMSAVTARIAIVPGRSVIGVELPNPVREMVYLREMLQSDIFQNSTQNLAIALGKDIGGSPVVADLARMPHLLVAGTTGSGKSVAINTMILSLLYRLPPERCRFIMVDPKMLELSVYDGIPHLLTPVVTDPKKAVVALRWAVREMESRYEAMSKLGVRNIEGYNARITEMIANGETMPRRVPPGGADDGLIDLTPTEPVALPFIVVIVDEMADLMLVAGKEIEAAIQRLAQMARAAGIHLIMATQRPSVDVITGTIKANFPTRISFQVTSRIDSRTILGEAGAEQLLGQGDMLYMQGGGRITRVHGPFVSDSEVEEIVHYVKAQGAPNYVTAITEEEDDAISADEDEGGGGNSADDLYMQAVTTVVRDQRVSISSIQRQLQIGYNRAARLVERMEQERIVTPPNHQGKREVLMSTAGLSAKRAGV